MAILLIFLAIHLYQAGKAESQCPINCQKCSGINSCDICKPGYYKRYYNYFEECTQCRSGCRICSSWTRCILCENGYVLSQVMCQQCSANCASCSLSGTCERCNTGYYVTSNQFCYSCPDRCSTCSNWTNCQSCIHGYYLQDSDCIKCPEACSTCSSQFKCSSCHTGFYLPYNYLSTNWRCKECPAGCATCTTLDKCESCNNGFYLSNNYCYACHNNCNKTSNAVSSCFQENGTCLIGCVSGFTGHNCTEAIPAIQQRTMVLAITGSALGVVVIVAAAVTLMLLARSRRNQFTRSSVGVDSDRQHVRCSIRNPIHDDSVGVDNYTSLLETDPYADNHVYAVVQ